MTIDRRFLIEEDLGEVKAELFEILDQLPRDRPGFAYRIRELMEVLPTQTARDAPVVRAVAGAIERMTGGRPEFVCSQELTTKSMCMASRASKTASPTGLARWSRRTSPTSTSRSMIW